MQYRSTPASRWCASSLSSSPLQKSYELPDAQTRYTRTQGPTGEYDKSMPFTVLYISLLYKMSDEEAYSLADANNKVLQDMIKCAEQQRRSGASSEAMAWAIEILRKWQMRFIINVHWNTERILSTDKWLSDGLLKTGRPTDRGGKLEKFQTGHEGKDFDNKSINKKLDRLACDPGFTKYLSLVNGSSDDSVCPLPDIVLNRFCSQILPKIHHHIQQLDLESSTMERILSTTSYPNLHSLRLFKLHSKTAASLFTNHQSALSHMDPNQIDSLTIDINQYEDKCRYSNRLSFGNSPPATIFSSTLLELHVSLIDLTDCLYLLDGRFSQLHTLRVKTVHDHSTHTILNNKEKLLNLKYFSLEHGSDTDSYDNLIIPLLQRMINLEELTLYLIIVDKQTLIDGVDIKKNILDHMSRLKKFSFPIRSNIYLNNEIHLPSNDDIQNTFKDFENNEIIISYIDCLITHDDYIEEFLIDSVTFLPNTVDLIVEYEAIKRVTENFTRTATKINCSRFIRLQLYVPDDDDINLDDIQHYFSRAKMLSYE
ncbi:hypothetical protein I4U23_016809 [Adineta vaga]|nr:hypothetical protein I4U23_016809 [Adineta vaga]